MVGLGARFVEPQPADLAALYAESDPLAPIIFVLSTGTDPAAGMCLNILQLCIMSTCARSFTVKVRYTSHLRAHERAEHQDS